MPIPDGTFIGRYQVQKSLGAGGMGEIYLALDVKLGRPVALKLLAPEVAADSRLLARFRREAQSIIALNHPHVLTVYDVGDYGDSPYIASEYVEGITLRQRMAEGGMRLEEVLRVGEQVASALVAAHAAGIVHRDVKPENVMLRPDGYVKVLDFGVAKILERLPDRVGGTHVTLPHTLVGTVRYMSPEQVRGQEVDPRSDLWSLGVVLYELLTGCLPFDGPSPSDAIAAILTAPLVPASEVSPSRVPRELDRVLSLALERDVDRRYRRAADLLADLGELRRALDARADAAPPTRVLPTVEQDSGGPWREIAEALRSAAPPAPPPRHNLPAQPTSFIGRETEVAAVVARLRRPDVRLLVLTGPGGAGKTRLAVEAAAALVTDHEDGVWLVPLAAVADADAVPAAIAGVLGVKELADQAPLDALAGWLRARRLLLVLDNFEQVVGAAPGLARLLAAARGLKLLVTSREVLRLSGEHDYAVPPLALPETERLPPPVALERCASVALFVSRAAALAPDFRLDERNAPAVAELCRRLDGLPLAIELAAARIRVLPPAAMLKRLDERFRLLAAGPADLPDRQRTMRSTLDWGYDLLAEPERRLFRALAVFRDPFTLGAAEAVAGGDGAGAADADLLEGLGSLVDKSLLQRLDGHDEEPRFALLETVREYALEQLGDDEREALRRRHAAYFLDLVERAAPELTPNAPSVPLAELERGHDDLRAALRWALEQGDPEPALRFVGALRWFWYLHGHYREGRRWLDEALARGAASSSPAKARALLGAGVLAFLQCDYDAAQALLAQSGELARDLGERRVLAASLQFSGSVARERADYARALELHDESLRLWRELQDERGVARSLNYLGFASWLRGDFAETVRLCGETFERFRDLADREGMAWSLLNLAAAACYDGQLERARSLGRECLKLSGEAGYKEGIAWSLNLLGVVALRDGRAERAQALLQRSLELHRDLGDRWRMASVLEALAAVARARGQVDRAARLAGGAAALREALGTPLAPVERADHERDRQAAIEAVGAPAWERLARQGRDLGPDRVIAYALEREKSAELESP